MLDVPEYVENILCLYIYVYIRAIERCDRFFFHMFNKLGLFPSVSTVQFLLYGWCAMLFQFFLANSAVCPLE